MCVARFLSAPTLMFASQGSLFFEIADKEKEKGRKKLASSGLEKVLSTDGKEGGSQ